MQQFSEAYILSVILAILCQSNAKDIFRNHNPHYGTETRIIDGHPVVPHSVKFIVALTMYDNTTKQYYGCGGSLISDRHILTAAHCVPDGWVVTRAQFGAHNRSRSEPDQTSVSGKVNFDYKRHYYYNPRRYSRDIAIIKLRNPLNLNSTPHVEVAKLPEPEDVRKSYFNEIVQTYGWGLVNDNPKEEAKELMGVNVTVMNKHICYDQMQEASYSSYLYPYEICTSGHGPHGSIGGCHGDSGGPLVSNGTLIGVMSRGASGNCTNQEPTVYVNVAWHLEWIEYLLENF